MAEFLAGEISREDRRSLEKHLLVCGACHDDFELARAGAKVEWAEVAVPQALLEATRASFRMPSRMLRLFRWATAAAAVLAVAALVLTPGRPPKAPAPSPAVEACQGERPERLASLQQDAVVGMLLCKDEDGRPAGELGLLSHAVSVEILDGIAKTTVEEEFENHTDRRLEGTFQFPLPPDASISRLALEVNGKIEEGTCLERERAREVFESIVSRMKDPALLEWQPGGLFKCRIFPVEPRATKRVIVAYTQALPFFRGKMTYVYPLANEKTRTHPPVEVRIDVLARFTGALATIESPSHHLEVRRKNSNEASMSFRAAHYRPNNDFVVTLEPADEELRVVSHRPEGEDGYFACFVTPRGGGERSPGRYSIILDASASINAPRLDVARRLVRAVMERRIEGDRFEILTHNVEVESSGEVDLRAANDFMDRIRPIGGSDVLQALRTPAADREIIYIGKGSPTFGETEGARILEGVKGRRIRTIAVGSDANLALLGKLGGLMQVSPNDDVPKRVSEIAATIGSPVISEIRIEGGDAVRDVVGVRDLFFGERLIIAGRYRGESTKLVFAGRGYRRELDVSFPAKEEGNNYVRRLWAQRKISDLLAQGPATKPEVTALGVKFQVMTPFTSFLVLENEQMWKDHQLKREVQKQDQVLGKQMEEEKKRTAEAEANAREITTKREVTRRMAELLQQSYRACEERRYDRTMALCDEILQIDPDYPVAKDLKEGAGKARHADDPSGGLSRKVQELKKLTDSSEPAVIPMSQTVRFPSRDEWAEISRRLLHVSDQAHASSPEQEKIARELESGRSAQDQEQIYESQRHYELALAHNNRGDFDKAAIEARKAVETWHENLAARKLFNDVNRITRGGRQELGARSIAEDARDDFRLRTEQAQIEITKHVRDGERYLNARMYEQAAKEFENAEFKIENIPYEVRAMNELLPLVKDSIVKTRNARILEDHRTEEAMKRMAEAEASAHEGAKPGAGSEWEERLNKLKSNFAVTEQAKVTPAEEHYRLAERYYQSGDFEKSTLETQKALQASPNHAPSRALYTENQFVLGQGKAIPSTLEYDQFMSESLVRHQQLLIEIDNAFERGKRNYSQGDLGQAEREFRTILECAKWMPTGIELEARRRAALDMLDRTRGAARQSIVDLEKSRLSLVEEERSRDDFRGPLELFSIATNRAVPGAPITDALPAAGEADLQLSMRELEAQLAQVQKLTTNVEEQRFSLSKSRNEKSLAVAELEYSRQLAWRLEKDLALLEAKRVEIARGKKELEERLNAVVQAGGNPHSAHKKPLEAKVTALSSELGLVVISIGKDDGVLEGDEFTVHRGGDLVATIVIDRADRKWAAGKIVLRKTDPRMGDEVSNHFFVSGTRLGIAESPRPDPESARLDQSSRENLKAIRAKMGLRE
jgi:Ca-activated chloride channel family protein